MAEEYAIRVKDITKIYKLYSRNRDRMLDAFGWSGKKRYNEHYALRNVSFDIRKGETVGIIGTNGAGKSTVLKIITGVLNPTSGSLEIDGRISALLELGAGFNPEYTGIENIYLNGTMMGYSREEVDARMDKILSFADIGEFVHQPVKTYSSGMFVRLAFAVAINIDPEILVVDEALSVGDVFFQTKCYQKFEDFRQEGKTILFVSHDLGSIAKYCDRVILLNKGEMLAEGTPKEMIDLYKKILTGSYKDRMEAEKQYRHVEEMIEGKELNHSLLGEKEEKKEGIRYSDTGGSDWKGFYRINPDLNEYGSHKAEIIDFAVTDAAGDLTASLIKKDPFTIRYKVRFYEDIKDPIFTFTFKTVRGIDVTGTNTMFEKQIIPLAKAGEVYQVEFTQNMDLQGGEYLLSISCTGHIDGELKAYHRLYDLINLTVISDKDTVGFYDMNSKASIRLVES